MAVKSEIRRVLFDLRQKALGPVIARLDVLTDETTRRLDELAKRVTDMEVTIQAMEGRSATLGERDVAHKESQARLSRRLDEIEKLLSDR
ncbi:MAG TPA: hypothetical protein VG435_17940 [Acidimicrobiales bacterium]|nr:hypothetical protein [Acidimicrobiales bacterium]